MNLSFLYKVAAILCIGLIACNNKPKAVQEQSDSLAYYKKMLVEKQTEIDNLSAESDRLKNYDVPYMDYVDLIELFSIPEDAGYNVQNWDTGEKHVAIKWKEGDPDGDAVKSGCVTVKINNEFTAESDGVNLPCNWGILLFGSNAGITQVKIQTGFQDGSFAGQLVKLLRNRGYTVTKLQCSSVESASEINSLFEYESSEYKGWFHYEVTGGSGGSAESVTLFFEKPEVGAIQDLDTVDCNQNI